MIVDTAYDIQAHLLSGDGEYAPNYIFVEYKNVQNLGEIVQDESLATDTIEHYSNLRTYDSDRDYLAIPITIKPRIVEPTGDSHTAIEYSVVTSGITHGVNGLPFSSENNSVIYSLGLVTRIYNRNSDTDILFARTSFEPEKQMIKTTSDMYITWTVEL